MKKIEIKLMPLTRLSLLLCISLLLCFLLYQKVGYSIVIAPLIVAAGITAAGSALGAGGSAIAQGKMNKKTRQFSERMYGVQRKDALADWQMQNEYNSPEMQMQRLREAGLNPNLVYDNGASFGSPDAVRSFSAPSWNPQAPDYSAAGQSLGNSLASCK